MTIEEILETKNLEKLKDAVPSMATSELLAVIDMANVTHPMFRIEDGEPVWNPPDSFYADAADVARRELDTRIPPRRHDVPQSTHERCVAHDSLGRRCVYAYAHRGIHSFDPEHKGVHE